MCMFMQHNTAGSSGLTTLKKASVSRLAYLLSF